ncbi:hypothetical protein [Streptomyces sp. NPDC049915]|uniref:hypothetical protein n=1 Tax=Streptomyces sp. NPDC049915 TaxID=3155510 RepID=UPI003431F14D
MARSLCLPANSLLEDLCSRGVTTVAEVIGVDNKPKYVKVRFAQGPERGTEVKLSDYAGMYPDTREGTSALALCLLSATVAAVLRPTVDPQDLAS